jgi:hypothetical protein
MASRRKSKGKPRKSLRKSARKPASQKWIASAPLHYHTPAGLFLERPQRIAAVLLAEAPNYKTAMLRLTFYINRAGRNLSASDRKRLAEAKRWLRALGAGDVEQAKPRKTSRRSDSTFRYELA